MDLRPAEKIVISPEVPGELAHKITHVFDTCIDCPKCHAECAFLARYGTPREIVAAGDLTDPEFLTIAYECSLCGLCGAVCPVGLKPEALFLEMRRAAVKAGKGPLKQHATLLAYEKRGTSRRYTYYSFPAGCRTVFFPGCTLPGTRPTQTRAIYEHLKKHRPNLGIVLDCCSKPSHDLGCQDLFLTRFMEMKAYLVRNGIQKVAVACPNCYHVFSRYGKPLEVISIYEMLLDTELPASSSIPENCLITIHDPCVLRDETEIQQSVRKLSKKIGFSIIEMRHAGKKTMCCGEGGAVECVESRLPNIWRNRRKEEASGRRMVTYCAGCANSLKKVTPVSHILDAIIDPHAAMAGCSPVSSPPFTYLNRLRLKRQLKKNDTALVTRERHGTDLSAKSMSNK